MTSFPRPCWLVALALLAGPTASLAAPSTSSPVAADPTQPQASVPATTYRSAFTRYRPLADITPIPWREANDTVTRIGGWRAYAREAAQPEAAASAPVAAPASPPPPAKEHRHGH